MYRQLIFIDFLFALIGTSVLNYLFEFDPLKICTLLLVIKMIDNRMKNPLHAYRDLLQKPDTGPHSITLYGIPIVDFIITFIGAYGLSYFLELDLFYTFGAFWLLGQYLHYIFGVNTRFFNKLGLQFEEEE